MLDLPVFAYTLEAGSPVLSHIKLVVCTFNEDGTGKTWGIKKNESAMSKDTGEFEYEPRPSSRDDDFFEEFRYDSAEEALASYEDFHGPVART